MAELTSYGGQRVAADADGMLAVFHGLPSTALECARAMSETAQRHGIRSRIGVHAGECVLVGDAVGGPTVDIAEMVQGYARPGEVLVTESTCGMVIESGLRFEERGTVTLPHIPCRWPLFALTTRSAMPA